MSRLRLFACVGMLAAGRCPAEILNIRQMELAGQATVTASPWDLGSKDNLFDQNWDDLYRSAAVNPAVITVEFAQPQATGAARARFSNTSHHEWTLEAADTLEDLEAQSGTYIKIFGPTLVEGDGKQWAEWNDSPVTRRVYRFTVRRLYGDNYVHIEELELQTPEPSEWVYANGQLVRINTIEVSPATAELPVGWELQYAAEGSLSYGPDRYDVTFAAAWSSSDNAVAAVAPGGLATAIAPGAAAISADIGVVHGQAGLSVRSVRPVDLDVGFIHRTPEFNRFAVSFEGDQHIDPAYLDEPKWPAPGEAVTYTARIFNKGDQPAADVAYRWLFDGKVVQEGSIPSMPGQSAMELAYTAPWPADTVQTVDVPPGAMDLDWPQKQRAVGDHAIRLELDPAGKIAEQSELNNTLEDPINALAFWLYMDQTTYDRFSSIKGFLESYSPEDWGRMQLIGFERRLRVSGCPQRLRLDRLIVVPDGALDTGGAHAPYGDNSRVPDGRWGFQIGEWSESGVRTWAKIVQDPLTHEWGHQIGIIDEYQYDIPTGNVFITRNGKRVAGTALMPLVSPWNVYYGNIKVMYDAGNALVDWSGRALMADASAHYLSAGSAAGMTRNLGLRRGFFGDYLGAIQQGEVRLRVRRQDGSPVAFASVRVFQREPDATVPDVPKFAGITGADGAWTFPRQALPGWYGGPALNNPWSWVNNGVPNDTPSAVGANAVLIVELSIGNKTEYHFVEVDQLNVAMSKGVLDDYTIDLTTYESRAGNRLPEISFNGVPDNVSMNEGDVLEATISASDADGDPVALSVTPLSNSAFDPATGRFTFRPDSLQVTAYGGYTEWMAATFIAGDGKFTATRTMTFRVADVDGLALVNEDQFAPPCYADFTGDGALDLFDFLAYVNAFNAGDAAADCDGNQTLDLFDFLCFVNAFSAGC